GGTLVIAGSYHRVGKWYETARFRRVVLLYNVFDPIGAASILERLCLPGKPKIELLFASEGLRRFAGLPGHFEPSPIDTDLFSPKPAPRGSAAQGILSRLSSRLRRDEIAAQAHVKPEGFVVGRLSRDEPVKHHAGAPEF